MAAKQTYAQRVEVEIEMALNYKYVDHPIHRAFNITYAGKKIEIRISRSKHTIKGCTVTLPFMVVCKNVCKTAANACKMYSLYNREWRLPSTGTVMYSPLTHFADGHLQMYVLRSLPSKSEKLKYEREEFEANVALFLAEVKPQIESFIIEDIKYSDFEELIDLHNASCDQIVELQSKINDLELVKQEMIRSTQQFIDNSVDPIQANLIERAKRIRLQ